jgi:hypothetical protein
METPSFRFRLDRDFTITQDTIEFPGSSVEPLDNGYAMFAPVRSTFEFDDPEVIVDLVLDVEDGRPVVVEFTVRRKPGGPPVEFVARDVIRGVSLRDLMAEAMAWVSLEPVDEATGQTWRPVRSVPKLDEITSGTRARRLPMSDERLRATAKAFLDDDGGVEAVERLDGWQCERRQAQRAIKAARERGFLTEGKD